MKKFLSALLVAGCGLFVLGKSARRAIRGSSNAGAIAPKEIATAEATRRYMMYVLLPFWFVPGILDWIWHRQIKIETTSGTEESLIHTLMMTEVGLPIVIGLFLEINSGVFLLMIAAAILHDATAF